MVEPEILIINPNSNPAVTSGLDAAVAGFRAPGLPRLTCVQLNDGPFGIESQAHVDGAGPMLARYIATNPASAYVIACYSDPGLYIAREATARPVFGIAACGMLDALARADRFGVIAIRDVSIKRHLRYMRQMGVMERCVGERALDMSVAETASGEGTLARMIAVGTALRDLDKAEAIVMGCAGMARHRAPLESALGIPVIDPTQSAVAMAIGAVVVGSGQIGAR
jgi:allantoin racemase